MIRSLVVVGALVARTAHARPVQVTWMDQVQTGELADDGAVVFDWKAKLPAWAEPQARHVRLTITPSREAVEATETVPAHEVMTYTCVVEGTRGSHKGEVLFDVTLAALPGQRAEFIRGVEDAEGVGHAVLRVDIGPGST